MATILQSRIISYPHGFSTRKGGISSGAFSSLNLGLKTGDEKMRVRRNWMIFLADCGINTWEIVCGNQVHGNKVLTVTKENAGNVYAIDPLPEADGFVTNEPGVPVAVFTADCIPLILTDEVNGVAGAIHCGWRSTVADIEGNAIEAMKSLGAHERNIRAAIGPAIRMCCFEVGEEVVEAAFNLIGGEHLELIRRSDNPGKYMLDLAGIVKVRLIQLGIQPSNVEDLRECTMCNPDLYWSHRLANGVRGSQASVVMVPKQ